MKILLITTLYPAYKNQSKIEASYAVHYFAKQWVQFSDVSVIRLIPSYPKELEFFRSVKSRNYIDNNYENSYIIDGVNVKRVAIRKYPKIDYRINDIQNTVKNVIKSLDAKKIPDFIICDMLNPSIYVGEKIAKKFSAKLIASLHNSDIFYLSKNKNYKKYLKIESSIEKIVFRSNRVERHFWELYNGGKSKKNFLTIPFGIEKEEIMSGEKIRYKVNKKIKEIIVACSLKKLKKVDILIRAFSKINNQNNYILRVIGDGPERKGLIELSNKLGCKNSIIFEGKKNRKEVLSYMEKADIFAMVSSPETFGLVYTEAMAKGCITIGAKGEGIDGVIINGENGFLCTPDSIEELRSILQKVIELDKNQKRNILCKAIDTVEGLTYEKLALKFLKEVQH